MMLTSSGQESQRQEKQDEDSDKGTRQSDGAETTNSILGITLSRRDHSHYLKQWSLFVGGHCDLFIAGHEGRLVDEDRYYELAKAIFLVLETYTFVCGSHRPMRRPVSFAIGLCGTACASPLTVRSAIARRACCRDVGHTTMLVLSWESLGHVTVNKDIEQQR